MTKGALKYDLYIKVEDIMETHNCKFLINTIFEYFNLAELIEFVEFLESEHEKDA